MSLSDPSSRFDSISETVREQYESFPYPAIAPNLHIPPHLDPPYSYVLAQYARVGRLHSPKGKRVLAAGCGTGFEIHVLAMANPGLGEIIGVDFSRSSVEIAQQRIHSHHLRNCEARVGNLLDPVTLPEGPFDMICSSGVLHHTADPNQALRNLVERLAPDGVMMLMLYSQKGRIFTYLIREALERLGVDQLPIQEKIAFARDLLSSASPESQLRNYAEVHHKYYQNDENIIDNFFHAKDVAFDISQIPNFLATAGLEFLDVVSPIPVSWDPANAVSPTEKSFYQRYEQLSRIDQLSVVELLTVPFTTRNIFWCCHAGMSETLPCLGLDLFKHSLWQLNPDFLAYAKVSYLDRTISFSELCASDTSLEKIPVQNLTLYWPLFSNSQSKAPFTLAQLQHQLLPIAKEPQTGSDLLNAQPAHMHDHALDCFRRWESHRIVLRV